MSSKTAAEQLAESEYPPQFDRYEWLRAAFIKGYAAGQESRPNHISTEERAVIVNAIYDAANRCATRPDIDAAIAILWRLTGPNTEQR